MGTSTVAQQEVCNLCKEVLKACHQLPESPNTTQVRATSSKLNDLLRCIGELWAPLDARGRGTMLQLLVVETNFVPEILACLLWSLPLLPSELSNDPQGPAYHAWYAAGDLILALAGFGSAIAVDEPAAISALLEQLQPACNVSKPGE